MRPWQRDPVNEDTIHLCIIEAIIEGFVGHAGMERVSMTRSQAFSGIG
jgi:hypothetical protein